MALNKLQEEITKLLEESEHIAMRRKEASEMLKVWLLMIRFFFMHINFEYVNI